MDGARPVSSQDLYERLGTAAVPVLVDACHQDTFGTDDRLIIGAFHDPPEDVERWQQELLSGRPVVAYFMQGHEISQGVAAALARAGIQAAHLEGGIATWKQHGLPTRKKAGGGSDRRVTREYPISYGLSRNFPDDHEMLRHGMVMYDALDAWCRLRAEAGQSRATATA